MNTERDKRDLRIVFMGTPDFAVGILSTLLDEGRNIVGVITAPDKPAGRGRKLSESAVKRFAVENGLTLLQPTNLKSDTFLESLSQLNANLQIVVAFRMLPKVVWDMPRYGTFNLHASLLPQYRGAAPINWAIINREKKTGVTTFFIDEKIDTGAIIMASEISIDNKETAGSLHDKLMELGSTVVSQTVSLIENGSVSTHIQNKDKNYKEAPKLHSENTKIDWNKDPEAIDALVRGLSPYPVAWTYIKDKEDSFKVKIFQGETIEADHQFDIGAVETSNKELKIAIKNGFYKITELQFPGKRKMDTTSFLNGFNFSNNAKTS